MICLSSFFCTFVCQLVLNKSHDNLTISITGYNYRAGKRTRYIINIEFYCKISWIFYMTEVLVVQKHLYFAIENATVSLNLKENN